MKKLLLLLLCVPGALLGMQKAADNLNNFLTMERKHKQEWMEYKKATCNAKIDLEKKHKDQWFDFKQKHIAMLAKGENPEAFLTSKLNDMIKLHEEQKNDWKVMYETLHKKCADIVQSQKTELDNFKKSIMPPAPEEKKAEEMKAEETETK